MPSFGPNIPQHEALRWSIDAASMEFRVSKMSLRKYLAGIGARPDAGGCFSTIQLVEALYGNLYAERLGLTREHRKKAALHNAATRGALVDKASLMAMFSRVADAMCSRIRASGLSRDEQDDLLKELSGVPVSIDGIAAEQSRLPRGRMHDGDGDDDLDEEDVADGRKTRKTRFRTRPGFKGQKAQTA
jgi:hypothetical protein